MCVYIVLIIYLIVKTSLRVTDLRTNHAVKALFLS